MSRYNDEDILRFLYDEMPSEESEAFLTALCSEEGLWERYEMFQEVVEQASGLRFEPSEESMQRIQDVVKATPALPAHALANTDQAPVTHASRPAIVNNLVMAVMALLVGIGLAFVSPEDSTDLSLSASVTNEVTVSSPLLTTPAAFTSDPVSGWDDSQLDHDLDLIRTRIDEMKTDHGSML